MLFGCCAALQLEPVRLAVQGGGVVRLVERQCDLQCVSATCSLVDLQAAGRLAVRLCCCAVQCGCSLARVEAPTGRIKTSKTKT